jgi:hypothetical protein
LVRETNRLEGLAVEIAVYPAADIGWPGHLLGYTDNLPNGIFFKDFLLPMLNNLIQ